MTDPWLARQVRRSVRTWGEYVTARLHEVEYVEYDPPKKPTRPIPIHDLASALHLSTAESVYEGGLPEPTDVDLGALLAEMRTGPVA